MDDEVNTKFTSTDKVTPSLKQMAKEAAEWDRRIEKYQKKQVAAADREAEAWARRIEKYREKSAVIYAPAAGGGGGHGGGGAGHGGGGHTEGKHLTGEQAMFKHDKEEAMLRKKRIRHEKLHDQKEQLLNRVGEMALMAVVGEQNKLAQALAKTGATMQGLGFAAAGFGGTIGKIGQFASKLGGWFEVGALVFEGAIATMELFGVDVAKVEGEIKKFGKELIGSVEHEKEAYRALGFKSEADAKAADEINKRWKAEAAITKFLGMHLADMKPFQESGSTAASATEAYQRTVQALTTQAKAFDKSVDAMDYKEVQAKIEEALKGSAAAWHQHSAREAELEELEKGAAGARAAIPYKATALAMDEHYRETRDYVNTLVHMKMISQEEASAVAAGIETQLEKNSSLQNEMAAFKERENLEVKQMQAIKVFTKQLKVVPLNASVDAFNKMNERLLLGAELLAPTLGLKTGEQFSHLLEEMKSAATEKQHRVFDFRGSRFDIKQAFSDVDPDRIAVAFSNDLASQGERRLMSQFSPVWSG